MARRPSENQILKEKLAKFEYLAERFLNLQNQDELCGDGKEIYRDVAALLGRPVDVTDPITVCMVIQHFELPSSSNPIAVDSYLVTVKDKNGNVIVEDKKPSEVWD